MELLEAVKCSRSGLLSERNILHNMTVWLQLQGVCFRIAARQLFNVRHVSILLVCVDRQGEPPRFLLAALTFVPVYGPNKM